MDSMRKIRKHLKCDDRLGIREPDGRKGGLFVTWDNQVEVKQIEIHDFCIELRIAPEAGETDLWIILVYASPDGREMQQQWDFLKARRQQWGPKWVLGGDLNDTKSREEEKKGGR